MFQPDFSSKVNRSPPPSFNPHDIWGKFHQKFSFFIVYLLQYSRLRYVWSFFRFPSFALNLILSEGAQPKKTIHDKNELVNQYRARMNLE